MKRPRVHDWNDSVCLFLVILYYYSVSLLSENVKKIPSVTHILSEVTQKPLLPKKK